MYQGGRTSIILTLLIIISTIPDPKPISRERQNASSSRFSPLTPLRLFPLYSFALFPSSFLCPLSLFTSLPSFPLYSFALFPSLLIWPLSLYPSLPSFPLYSITPFPLYSFVLFPSFLLCPLSLFTPLLLFPHYSFALFLSLLFYSPSFRLPFLTPISHLVLYHLLPFTYIPTLFSLHILHPLYPIPLLRSLLTTGYICSLARDERPFAKIEPFILHKIKNK